MTNPKNKSKPVKETPGTEIKKLLADYLGVELEDINEDDTLLEDLHMSASDLSEFVETLKSEGADTSSLIIEDIETVSDIIESITSEELG